MQELWRLLYFSTNRKFSKNPNPNQLSVKLTSFEIENLTSSTSKAIRAPNTLSPLCPNLQTSWDSRARATAEALLEYPYHSSAGESTCAACSDTVWSESRVTSNTGANVQVQLLIGCRDLATRSTAADVALLVWRTTSPPGTARWPDPRATWPWEAMTFYGLASHPAAFYSNIWAAIDESQVTTYIMGVQA